VDSHSDGCDDDIEDDDTVNIDDEEEDRNWLRRPAPQRLVIHGCGGWIWTSDLWVM